MLFSDDKGMSLEIQDIERLMDKFEKSSLSEMSVNDNKVSFVFKKNIGASAVDYINKDLVAVKPQEVAVNTESNVVAANESVEAPKEAVKEETKLEGSYVTAPVSGIFYSASKPGEPNFVKEGDTVKKGDVLGLIEAMKVMNELLAPKDGVVEKINVSDETFVEYGQELICLRDC